MTRPEDYCWILIYMLDLFAVIIGELGHLLE